MSFKTCSVLIQCSNHFYALNGCHSKYFRIIIVNDHLKDIIDDDYIGNVRASTIGVGHNEIFAFCEAYVQFSDPVPRH